MGEIARTRLLEHRTPLSHPLASDCAQVFDPMERRCCPLELRAPAQIAVGCSAAMIDVLTDLAAGREVDAGSVERGLAGARASDAFIFELLRMLPGFCVSGAATTDKGLVLVRWVERLADPGRVWSTTPVPTKESKSYLAKCQRAAAAHAEARSKAAKAAADRRRTSTAHLDDIRRLDEAAAASFALSKHLLATQLASAAPGGGDGGGATVTAAAQVDDAARLLAFAMGFHRRLGAGSAVGLLEADSDVLQLIAERVRGKPASRRRGASQLRRAAVLLGLEHRRRVAAEQLADTRRVELERADRRQVAAAAAAAGQATAQASVWAREQLAEAAKARAELEVRRR